MDDLVLPDNATPQMEKIVADMKAEQSAEPIAPEPAESAPVIESAEPIAPDAPVAEQPAETESVSSDPLKIKVGDKEYDVNQARSALGRQNKFNEQLDEMKSSEEMKLGTIAKAAMAGDKSALKKLMVSIKENQKVDDLGDIEDTIDGDLGDYDEDDAIKQKYTVSEMDSALEDVKEDVDFDENIAKIPTELKKRVPEKVYDTYYEMPEGRRFMYELVKSGRSEELLSALDQFISELPHEKQLDIRTDPIMFKEAFLLSTQQVNAQKAQPEVTDQNDDSGVDAVSTGSAGRSINKASTPNYQDISKEDFLKLREKATGQRI